MADIDERIRSVDMTVGNGVQVALPTALSTSAQLVRPIRGGSVQERRWMLDATIDQISDDIEEHFGCKIVGVVGTNESTSETDELPTMLLPQSSDDAV